MQMWQRSRMLHPNNSHGLRHRISWLLESFTSRQLVPVHAQLLVPPPQWLMSCFLAEPQQTQQAQNFCTKPSDLTSSAMTNLTSQITSLCAYFDLPHSDTHSLSFPAQLFLQSLWLQVGKPGKAQQKQQLAVKEPLSTRHVACSKFVHTACLSILIRL